MKIFFSFLLLMFFNSLVYSQVTGKVTDPDSGDGLINATVIFLKNGDFHHGITTDYNGNYTVELHPGTYDVLCVYLGYADVKMKDVIVEADTLTTLNIEMADPIEISLCFVHTEYLIRLIERDPPEYTSKQRSGDIRRSPLKNIRKMAAMSAGVSFQ